MSEREEGLGKRDSSLKVELYGAKRGKKGSANLAVRSIRELLGYLCVALKKLRVSLCNLLNRIALRLRSG
jgi:hypothetical protein